MSAWALGTSLRPGLGYSPTQRTMEEEAQSAGLTREATLADLRHRILAVARKRLSADDAEDLTQDVLLLLATKYADVEDPGQLVALAIGILRRKLSDFWRKRARHGEGMVEDPAVLPLPDGAPGPETVAADRERVRLYESAAARLGERCRDLLRCKIEGQSFVEMANGLGRPVNTVYSWDHRCHQSLRALLGDRWAFVIGEEDR